MFQENGEWKGAQLFSLPLDGGGGDLDNGDPRSVTVARPDVLTVSPNPLPNPPPQGGGELAHVREVTCTFLRRRVVCLQ
jgi:hypothetical protein